MPITIQCPQCAARYSVDPRAVGRTVTCKQCQQKFVAQEEKPAEPEEDAELQLAPEPPRPAAAPRPAPAPVQRATPAVSMTRDVGDLLDDVITTREEADDDDGHAPPPAAKKKVKKKKKTVQKAVSGGDGDDDEDSGFGGRFMASMGGVGGLAVTILLIVLRAMSNEHDRRERMEQAHPTMVSPPQRVQVDMPPVNIPDVPQPVTTSPPVGPQFPSSGSPHFPSSGGSHFPSQRSGIEGPPGIPGR